MTRADLIQSEPAAETGPEQAGLAHEIEDLPRPGASVVDRGILLVGLGIVLLGAGIGLTLRSYEAAASAYGGGTYTVWLGGVLIGCALAITGCRDLAHGIAAGRPGYRLDPTHRHARRWWDGERWTPRVLDGECESLDPEGLRDDTI